jgi:hypothetical protein
LVSAHEEPAKTLHEKKEKEIKSQKFKNAGIKKSVAWKYSVNDGKIAENGLKTLVQEYDTHGNLSAIEAYKNDTLNLRVEYTFDLTGNIITDTDYSPEGKMLEKNIYQFDDQGRVISGKFFNDEEQMVDYFVMNKTDDRKTITFEKFKSDGIPDYRIIYTYDSDYDHSDYIAAKKVDANYELILRVEKKYNGAGLAIEKAVYGKDSTLSYTFFYEYDETGNILKITKQLPDGMIEWYDLYMYDLNGLAGEISSFDGSGNLTSTTKYTYEYFSY